jgi:hypothetical protein
MGTKKIFHQLTFSALQKLSLIDIPHQNDPEKFLDVFQI